MFKTTKRALAVLLAVFPLRGAYGLDVEDTQPVAVDAPADVSPDEADACTPENPADNPEVVEGGNAVDSEAAPQIDAGDDADGSEPEVALEEELTEESYAAWAQDWLERGGYEIVFSRIKEKKE